MICQATVRLDAGNVSRVSSQLDRNLLVLQRSVRVYDGHPGALRRRPT